MGLAAMALELDEPSFRAAFDDADADGSGGVNFDEARPPCLEPGTTAFFRAL
jgi:hypothetical protein